MLHIHALWYFLLISNIPQMISYGQICYNTTLFCIAEILQYNRQLVVASINIPVGSTLPGDINVNSLWPSDTICRPRSGSTLVQVMACCLTAKVITWTTDHQWSPVTYIRASSQEMPQSSITKIRLKIACLKFHQNFLGANELNRTIQPTLAVSLPLR